MNNRQTLPLFLIVTLFFAGCAVQPKPMDIRSAIDSAAEDLQKLLADQQNPVKEIDLNEAIARALKYNRERRVALMESSLASSDLELAHYDMLPQLAATAGYNTRNKPDASTSTGVPQILSNPPKNYTTSSDESHTSADLTFTWNLLDFGLSYVRAEQKADQYLIAREQERKAIHNLIHDVRVAYWRAASSQHMLDQVIPLKRRVDAALKDSKAIARAQLKPPLESLTYQRKLLEIRRSFEKIQKELLDARSQIATLMGMKPNARFKLKATAETDYRIPEPRVDVATLEKHALTKRPELMQSRYQQRITHAEGRAALLSLLPGISLTAGQHYDDDSYLLHDNWFAAGASITGNLINIFKYPHVQKQVENQTALEQERRLALMAGIMAQVHLADLSFAQAKQEYQTADEYLQVVRKIREQLRLLRDVKRGGELELITEELNTVVARLQRDMAYAELQNSYGRLFYTAGLDPFGSVLPDAEIETLSAAMDNTFTRWDNGDIGLVTYAMQNQISHWQGPGSHEFNMDKNTFLLGGRVTYQARQSNGQALPSWLNFDAGKMTFYGNPPASVQTISVTVIATNEFQTTASDSVSISLQAVNDIPVALPGEQFAVEKQNGVLMGQLEYIDADNDKVIFRPAAGKKLPIGMRLEPDGLWTYKAPPYYAIDGALPRSVTVEAVDPYNGISQTEIALGPVQ